MRIRRMKMVDFRRFEELELYFAGGVNLIRGPNESGKSTLVRALVAALFEKTGSAAARGKLNARWGAEALPLLELDFTDDDGEYMLVKDFEAGKVSLEVPGGAKPLASAKAVDTRLAELLGFRDPLQYLRTACVTHDQMVNLAEDGAGARKLASMLREVIVGGQDSSVLDRAIRELSSEVDDLKRGLERPTNNPGTIKRLQEEREMYLERQKGLSAGVADTLEQQQRLAEIEGLLSEKSTRLADLRRLVDNNMALLEAERKLEVVRERLEAADRAREASARLDALDLEMNSCFPGFEEVDARAEVELRKSIDVSASLKSLHEELASQLVEEEEPVAGGAGTEPEERPPDAGVTGVTGSGQAELEGGKSGSEETPRTAGTPRRAARTPRRGLGYSGLAAGFVLLVLGIVLGSAVHAALFALVAPAVLLLVGGTYLLASTPPATRAREAVAPPEEAEEPELAAPLEEEEMEAPAPPSPLATSLERAEAELNKIEARQREFLDTVGCQDAETFFEKFGEYKDMLAERKDARAALRALLGTHTLQQVEEERRKVALDVTVVQERVNELEPFRLEPDKLQAFTRERDALAGEVDALQTERDGLSFHLAKTASDPEESVKIEEVLNWLWEAEQSARRRLRVYTLALDAMRQASVQMLASAVPLLAESVGRTFERLTGGRYREVEVREDDLSISVYSQEKGEMIPGDTVLSSLSKGTASQLYLSARLELVDLLSGGRRPPLIFDDSFSYFDERRLRLLWGLLADVALEQQVLLFTCTSRYDALARDINIIDL